MTSVSKVYRYVLVLQDYYSSFLMLKCLTNKKTGTVIKAFWDVMAIFGTPETLLTDNGTEFVSALMKDLTEAEGIRHVLTYPYHAQGNAKNERSHMALRQILRIFAEEHPENWNKYIPKLQYALNTRETPPLEISAYERVFALTPRPLHNVTPFLEYDHEAMNRARSSLNDVLRKYQQQLQAAAATPPPPKLEIGNKVLLVQPFPRRSKSLHPAHGPYTITQLFGETGALVKHDITQRERRVPRRWIRLFITRKGGRRVGDDETKQNDKDDDKMETDNEFEDTAEKEKEPTLTEKEKETQQKEEEDEAIEEKVKDDEIREIEQAKKTEEEMSDDKETKKPGEDTEAHRTKRKRTEAEGERRNVKKKSRALARLQDFNKRVEKVTKVREPQAGNMVIVKQGMTVRVAEILEEDGESWKIQWYGTTSSRELPRRRWKWHPGWENKDGEIQYVQAQNGPGTPAICHIPKAEVIVAFNKLTLHYALPTDIVGEISSYTLG